MGNSQGKPVVYTDEVNLNHFRLLRVVGKGAFGKVRIVERKDSGLTFALKYIRKDEVVRSESVRNIIRERRMLEHLNHPFLCNLRYSFQDIEYLYLVVDLMNGGDLRFHIQRKAFTEETVRFWMAEIACALRYIHGQGIVHRDLKPDNVLLDSEGHVHLADFNVASDFKPGKPLTSKSGTLAYLAPEVFRGSGYLSEPDWWSLGVTMYECIYGKRPYEARAMKSWPRMCVQQTRRFATFVNHPFFQPIDFMALERKQIAPIFVPSSEKTNFDATYDLEELLLEEAPLEARARKQKPRAELRHDATSREIREDELHRMIETMFEPFDYTSASYEIQAAEAVAGKVPPPDENLETTLSNRSQARSQASSADGSPPISPTAITQEPQGSDNFPALEELRTALPQTSAQVPRPMSASKSFSRPLPPQRPQAASRQMSKGGGVQMVLDEGGSWSQLSDQTSSLPADAGADRGGDKGGSVLGFLSRKKGRDRSPKPKEPGVLGKYGARHIIN
ncbi:Serine/threonine-protein kinase 32B [Cyphellophora attinorum]|uniref:Serine/threonine-protein kinase 32B n=1 Tax=Cyphellophora attinorum TaxID=1664694 RepID=A0A0N1H1A2_9EURO|nr:Serine/threonine-protein kinase 32B [Phialophora attinorum]KPI34482.1 Serine/threonine-protein kinase 32B [Phialophora attinorum]